MPMWDDILGHEQNKEFLARLLQPGNRPHALLFYGPEGIGKKQLALRFAKTFLCQKPDEHPCGRCESCRLINLAEHSFAHPDFILVEQEAPGKDLKIEQIKEMSRQAAFAPALSSHKVCVIDAADRMTVEAANSLLKLLEEPPPNWMFILVASRLERLLPTILSRVIQLRFDQIPLALTQEALNRLGMERPELLARLAGGSLGAAVNLAAADAVSYRDQALEFLEALPLAQPMRYVASQPWLESYDKQGGLLFTEMLLFLARDVLLWQNGLEEQIYNCDCTDRLRRLAASWPASHLKQAADIAQQAYQAIESNAGAKLVLETVVLKTDILRKDER